jgi:sterol desaturase/sphingolipid hydroxylase (fatty acid hydroxylase superfamily)
MNTDDINLAYRIRHALNEHLDALPASTTERLAAARARAVAHKKADAALARRQRRPFFNIHAMLSMDGLGRVAVAVPLLAAVFGLAGLYQFEQQQRIAELAELDAAVLSDELPLTAYLDHGFNAYVASQPETQTQQRAAQ